MAQIVFYFCCLFFFKASVGAILLVTGWDALSLTGNSLLNITAIMALSFFPAAFARPVFYKFNTIAVQKLITYSLIISCALLILERLLMLNNNNFLFIFHFALWIMIFLIEVGCEKWYVSLSHNFSLDRIRKLSGFSMSIAQLGIICGPIFVMLFRKDHQNIPYIFILLCFITAAFFSIKGTAEKMENTQIDNSVNKVNSGTIYKKNLFVFAFALVWPTLTIFNLSIPVLAKEQYNSITVAGLLEVMIAIATMIAGLFHSSITRNLQFQKRNSLILITLFISTVITYYLYRNFILVSFGIFLLGFAFGYLRIELRAYLSKLYHPKDAGKIIASANSWSGILVVLYSFIFYLNSQIQNKQIAFIFPISFIICAIYYNYIFQCEEREKVTCDI